MLQQRIQELIINKAKTGNDLPLSQVLNDMGMLTEPCYGYGTNENFPIGYLVYPPSSVTVQESDVSTMHDVFMTSPHINGCIKTDGRELCALIYEITACVQTIIEGGFLSNIFWDIIGLDKYITLVQRDIIVKHLHTMLPANIKKKRLIRDLLAHVAKEGENIESVCKAICAAASEILMVRTECDITRAYHIQIERLSGYDLRFSK